MSMHYMTQVFIKKLVLCGCIRCWMIPGSPSPPGLRTRPSSAPRRLSMKSTCTGVRTSDLRWDASTHKNIFTGSTWCCDVILANNVVDFSWMSSWKPTWPPFVCWRRFRRSCLGCLRKSRRNSGWTTLWAAARRSSTGKPSRGYMETKLWTSSTDWRRIRQCLFPLYSRG